MYIGKCLYINWQMYYTFLKSVGRNLTSQLINDGYANIPGSYSAQTKVVLCKSQGHSSYRLLDAIESHLNACASSTCRHK